LSRATDKAEAFLALLRPLQRPLEVYCRRLLRDPAQAEDVLQEAVAQAFAKFDSFAPGTNFRAWVFRFATLEALARNRKREPYPWGDAPAEVAAEPPGGWPASEAELAALLGDPDSALDHFEDPVARAVRELPAPERAVLLLRAVGEFSYKDIHELLAIPLGSVIGYLSRARQKLRQALAGYAAGRGPRTIPGPTPGERAP
jgi:RNA polymerase sigma-70 factor (ECF subfamily)